MADNDNDTSIQNITFIEARAAYSRMLSAESQVSRLSGYQRMSKTMRDDKYAAQRTVSESRSILSKFFDQPVPVPNPDDLAELRRKANLYDYMQEALSVAKKDNAENEEWKKLAVSGEVMQAIKMFRAQNGFSLMESKAAVESWLASRIR